RVTRESEVTFAYRSHHGPACILDVVAPVHGAGADVAPGHRSWRSRRPPQARRPPHLHGPVRGPAAAAARDPRHLDGRPAPGPLALTFAACGLAHIADGIPHPPDGADPMRAAGGIIGFLASSPLASAVSRPGAVVLLVLLALFGALVVTGTPVRQIPRRVRAL